jgi:hypothetical protein
MQNRKLLETVADIAFIAGSSDYYSGDSRADISAFIWWAEEFEQSHVNIDWGDEDYMLALKNLP